MDGTGSQREVRGSFSTAPVGRRAAVRRRCGGSSSREPNTIASKALDNGRRASGQVAGEAFRGAWRDRAPVSRRGRSGPNPFADWREEELRERFESAVALDTNVLSEIMRPESDGECRSVSSLELDNPLISAVVFHELAYGAQRLPEGRRKSTLLREIDAFHQKYENRIIADDFEVANLSGKLRSDAQGLGRDLKPMDAMIAASALHTGAKLATRNLKDFIDLGIELINPWTQ